MCFFSWITWCEAQQSPYHNTQAALWREAHMARTGTCCPPLAERTGFLSSAPGVSTTFEMDPPVPVKLQMTATQAQECPTLQPLRIIITEAGIEHS